MAPSRGLCIISRRHGWWGCLLWGSKVKHEAATDVALSRKSLSIKLACRWWVVESLDHVTNSETAYYEQQLPLPEAPTSYWDQCNVRVLEWDFALQKHCIADRLFNRSWNQSSAMQVLIGNRPYNNEHYSHPSSPASTWGCSSSLRTTCWTCSLVTIFLYENKVSVEKQCA